MQNMKFFSYNRILRWMKAVIFWLTFILLMASSHSIKNTFVIHLEYKTTSSARRIGR